MLLKVFMLYSTKQLSQSQEQHVLQTHCNKSSISCRKLKHHIHSLNFSANVLSVSLLTDKIPVFFPGIFSVIPLCRMSRRPGKKGTVLPYEQSSWITNSVLFVQIINCYSNRLNDMNRLKRELPVCCEAQMLNTPDVVTLKNAALNVLCSLERCQIIMNN